jgi:outer membrane receptor protein involved in Fe transport
LDEASLSGTNSILSPKVGALLRLTEAASLYANISRGFRSTDGVIEDPSLPLIVAWSYESGVKIDARTTRASAALFRVDVSNEQTLNPATLEATSGGQSVRQGVDVEATWNPTATMRLSSEWTFTDAHYKHLVSGGDEDSPSPEPPAVLDGLRVFNTAKYVGVASAELVPPAARWRLRLSGNWVGPYAPFDEPGVLLGGYGLLHTGLLLRTGRFEWDLGVRNVLDRRYPELVAGERVSPGQPRAAYATARMIF